MSEPASISSGIAARYATALFELARDDDQLGALESGVDTLDAALKRSADLRAMIASPILTRDEQGRAIAAVAQRIGLPEVLGNTLGLMAQKRRLFVLPQLIVHLRALVAAHKGEITADVTAARELTKAQGDRLAEVLKASTGKNVKINLAVDAGLIGGLVVKVGSRMVDTSIRSRLANLQNAMKEVR